jgi:hypothetical protein
VEQADGRQGVPAADVDLFAVALTGWIEAVRVACGTEVEWPEKVGAGVYAAIEFLLEEPQMARTLLDQPDSSRLGEPYRQVVESMSELLDETVPVAPRPDAGAPAAAVAGIGLVVGDRLRAGQSQHLSDLCPEMHLMVLLPYLGFEEAKTSVEKFRVRGFS